MALLSLRAVVWAPVTPVTAQVERQAARSAWRWTASRPPCETTLSPKAPGSETTLPSFDPPGGLSGRPPSTALPEPTDPTWGPRFSAPLMADSSTAPGTPRVKALCFLLLNWSVTAAAWQTAISHHPSLQVAQTWRSLRTLCSATAPETEESGAWDDFGGAAEGGVAQGSGAMRWGDGDFSDEWEEDTLDGVDGGVLAAEGQEGGSADGSWGDGRWGDDASGGWEGAAMNGSPDWLSPAATSAGAVPRREIETTKVWALTCLSSISCRTRHCVRTPSRLILRSAFGRRSSRGAMRSSRR